MLPPVIVHTRPIKCNSDFVAYLGQLDQLYGPIMPGRPAKPVVLVENKGPIHVSKLSLAALAYWLTVEWLAKQAPNSTTSRSSGMTSRRVTLRIRRSPTSPHSTKPSTQSWKTSTVNG